MLLHALKEIQVWFSNLFCITNVHSCLRMVLVGIKLICQWTPFFYFLSVGQILFACTVILLPQQKLCTEMMITIPW